MNPYFWCTMLTYRDTNGKGVDYVIGFDLAEHKTHVKIIEDLSDTLEKVGLQEGFQINFKFKF